MFLSRPCDVPYASARRAPVRPALFLLVFFLSSSIAHADKLILYDGRVIEGCRVEERDQDLFAIFEHGACRLLPNQVKEILYDSDEEYVPRNDYEKEQLDKGFVLFEGGWMSKERCESILEKRRKKRAERLAETRRHLEWVNAWQKEKRHFTLITNSSEGNLEEYSDIFERFYSVFVKKWRISSRNRAEYNKPVIKIFRDRSQYLGSNAPPRSSGVFNYFTGEIRLYNDAADPRYTLDVLFHEGTHLMVQLMRPDFIFPIWVNEGLAEYYGASVIGRDGGIEVGVIQEGRLVALRSAVDTGKYIALERVLLTQQGKFGSLHYAEAWCFIHYLMGHDKYKSKFKGFLHALVADQGFKSRVFRIGRGKNMSTVSPVEALKLFKKKMGLSTLDNIEREFMDYVLYGLPDVGKRGYVVSARIHFRFGEYDEALGDIETALEMGSTDPNCYLYRGRIYAVKEMYEEAVIACRKAIDINPLNPHFHLELGRVLRESEDRIMMEEGLREYHLATEIEPENTSLRVVLDKALAGKDMGEIRRRKRARRLKDRDKQK